MGGGREEGREERGPREGGRKRKEGIGKMYEGMREKKRTGETGKKRKKKKLGRRQM